ncbi:hypothetical protein [Stygiolobus caldivivus]|uniref:Uncharacterized protein n=1 Tax=Stygiolobus caldivivus TaxID=2824673 RepID=A0A8D5ZI71_9CREN|nr:hypothetical protein [Stygiolobus caldivivus]BCU69346.1 hypothetical protein KN1_06430 [Stygiolobus caldivivus]
MMLRFYNVVSIAIYAIALVLVYMLGIPLINMLFYLASVSLNSIPYFTRHEIKGIKIKHKVDKVKDVILIPSKKYMGLYVPYSKRMYISSIAYDMPDVFLYIKYHEEGHSKQPFDITYHVSRSLSPFALAFSLKGILETHRKYKLLIRFLSTVQLILFISLFIGPSFLVSLFSGSIITILIFAVVEVILFLLINHLEFIYSFFLFILIFLGTTYIGLVSLTVLLFYIGYTLPSLAYEIDADNHAAMNLEERILISYRLFSGNEEIKTSFLTYVLSLLFMLSSTHPFIGYEYSRFSKLVKKRQSSRGV